LVGVIGQIYETKILKFVSWEEEFMLDGEKEFRGPISRDLFA
jgi:hypothetical protein